MLLTFKFFFAVIILETPVNGETLVTGTEYALESLTAGTEYKVTVKAVDAAGNVSEGAVHTFTTENAADTEAPTAPENVAVTDVTTTTAKVTWSEATDNVGVVGYNVYLNEDKVNETLITTTEYDLTALTEETEYTVRVSARVLIGFLDDRCIICVVQTFRTE